MRGGAARSNFVGYAQIYPTPKNRAYISPRRTREISKSSETLECATTIGGILSLGSETRESRAAGSSARCTGELGTGAKPCDA